MGLERRQKQQQSQRQYIEYTHPFVRSLRSYLRRWQYRNWNRNYNWNWRSRSNTKRRTISTTTGNHPRRSTRSSRMRRGGILLQKGGILIWRNHGQRSGRTSCRWPRPSTVWLRDVQVGRPATPTSSYIQFTVTWINSHIVFTFIFLLLVVNYPPTSS